MEADKEEKEILAIDEELAPHISEDEAQTLKTIQKKFMESYLEHKDDMPVEKWLYAEVAENLPECRRADGTCGGVLPEGKREA